MNFLMNMLTVPYGAENAAKFEFDPQQVLNMLPYMGKGMLVIFVLIGVIILVTTLINKIFSRK